MNGGAAVRNIVIAGGGTAGWMAAAALAAHFRGAGMTITVVESSAIGTIGVGEATIPTIRRFYARLGMTDAEVMQATHATAKLGIRFFDWKAPGSAFLHPFGLFGQDIRGVGFHHHWQRARSEGDAAPLEEYSLGASLAREGRASIPAPNPQSQLSVFDWALHLDAAAFAAHLRRYAEGQGVRRIDARIDRVERGTGGSVAALVLDNGERLAGDFFLDCTGFRALLLGETLGVGYRDWSHWLLCDSAFAVQSDGDASLPAYTSVTARSAGWQWRIPLRTREGNGIVFSSRFQSDDAARDELLGQVRGNLRGEPRRIGFTPSRRETAWSGNVVGLGLAAGFLEPLESTSIALIETGIERLKQLFPVDGADPALAAEFNDQTAQEMERVRDFLILHYALNGRSEPFWQACREIDLPDSLAERMALWRGRGVLKRMPWEMFSPASWLAIYAGYDCAAETLDPAIAAIDPASMARALREMRASIARTVADTPTHAEFLAQLDAHAASAAEPTVSKP